MQAYSLDLRERVVAAHEKGELSIAEVAAQFSVEQTFLKKTLRQKRQSGSSERLPNRAGAKRLLSPAHRSFLAKQIKEQSDATLGELQASLLKRKKDPVSPVTLSRELQRWRLPRKKSQSSRRNATMEKGRGSGGG